MRRGQLPKIPAFGRLGIFEIAEITDKMLAQCVDPRARGMSSGSRVRPRLGAFRIAAVAVAAPIHVEHDRTHHCERNGSRLCVSRQWAEPEPEPQLWMPALGLALANW